MKLRLHGNTEHSIPLFEHAARFLAKTGDSAGVWASNRHLSRGYLYQGRLEDSLAAAHQCIEMTKQDREDRRLLKISLNTYASTLHYAGRLEQSQRVYREADGIQAGGGLLSFQEIQYCHLLLDLKQYTVIRARLR